MSVKNAFGGRSLRLSAFDVAPSALGFAFGGRSYLRLRQCAFSGSMRLRRKSTPKASAPAAEEETAKKTAGCSAFGHTPLAMRLRRKENAFGNAQNEKDKPAGARIFAKAPSFRTPPAEDHAFGDTRAEVSRRKAAESKINVQAWESAQRRSVNSSVRVGPIRLRASMGNSQRSCGEISECEDSVRIFERRSAQQ
ncbi:hypothetical protein AXG93_1028s1170 [Marchantia polymorpha subsp. ruderalis]|uniref:Uncharacterized protein n=1 Tax=Marchantia polymorpha subsp. ruderalis TaxID=1480154 RepID=A0A176W8Y8_MARPO|nr:hypothetical protein AXG93_1028s1170 [Marchantia polymorpha subsp. ruderalis]